MKYTDLHYIRDFAQHEGKQVTVRGWVYNKRESKTNIFLVLRDGSGYCQAVVGLEAVGEEAFETAKKLTRESSLAITGQVVKDDRQMGGYELQAGSLELIDIAPEYPIKVNEQEHNPNFLSNNRHLWMRSQRQWAILRVRNEIIMAIHEFFQQNGFVQTDAPLFTGAACEGTTNLFETDFFGDPAFLSQSGQLYAEAMAMALGKVYTFGPTFRAEKSDTPRHLAEFWMIEPEMAFFDLDMDMDLIEDFIKHVVNRVIANCPTELEAVGRNIEKLKKVNQSFPRIPYTEAVKILRGEKEVNGKNAITVQEQDYAAAEAAIEEAKVTIEENEATIKGGVKKGKRNYLTAQNDKLRAEIRIHEETMRNIPNWIESAKNFTDGEDFGGSDETVLTRVFDAPVMVYNWPAKIKAFYMKEVEGDPDYVKGVDLLAPDGFGEIIGGSERETDLAVLERKIHEHDLDMSDFEWYVDLRRFGSVPHSGFGLGLERIVRWVCDLDHVRETIPFQRRYGRKLVP